MWLHIFSNASCLPVALMLTPAGHAWQRCGLEVVVLEARERIGGRVHTHSCGGLTAAVDLGASIITGTAIDEEKGLRPDPSAIIARFDVLAPGCHSLLTRNYLQGTAVEKDEPLNPSID